MKSYDQGSSLFWLLLSIFVLLESLRLGIGTLHNPGMGFMPFGASVFLGILSVILFLQASFRKWGADAGPLFSGTLWKSILPVLVTMIVYSRLMPVAGYLISTFLLMLFLFWILERKKVWLTFVLSLLSTFVTYYVFSVLLNCQFPSGLFGF
jgi:putative tricarboxylic transport membrane protein